MKKSLKVVAFGGTSTQVGSSPVNTVAPVISGTTTLGSVLTTTNGTWTGTTPITYSYQWKRNGSNILGETNSTYTLVVADSSANITCSVTATNSVGSSTTTSNTITAGNYAPINTVAPAITGTATEGQVVTCSTGTWTGAPTITYTYQWKRNGSNIGSATNSTYTLVTADVSQSITCEVTATNGIGSTIANSNTITPIASIDSDAQAFITAASITDTTQKNALDTLVKGLKSANLWTKMKAVYPMVGGTASSHSYNLKNPAQFQITWNGGLTHSSTGVLPNGTNGYGDLNLIPSNNLNSSNFHLSYYSRTNNSVSSDVDMGTGTSTGTYASALFLRRNNNTAAFDSGNSSSANRISASSQTNSQGFYIGSIRNNSDRILIKNGTNILTSSTSNNTNILMTANLFLFAYNEAPYGTQAISPNYFGSKQCAFASLGDGLTNTDASNLYTIVQNYQTILSRNI